VAWRGVRRLAAARNGASVILARTVPVSEAFQQRNPHARPRRQQPKDLSRWRETGIIEELKLTDAAANPQRSFEMWT